MDVNVDMDMIVNLSSKVSLVVAVSFDVRCMLMWCGCGSNADMDVFLNTDVVVDVYERLAMTIKSADIVKHL